MVKKLLLVACWVTFSLAGVPRGQDRVTRSIDPPMYGHGGRSARSYEFEEDKMAQEEYVRSARQAANTNYGAPGGGAQPSYQGGSSGGGRGAGGGEPLMPYRYGYAVQDDIGNDFNQQEQSDGAQITGQYSVVLPDCRIQTVTYSVRPETGFVAEVSYSDVGGGCSPAPPNVAAGAGGFGGGGGFDGGAQSGYGAPIRR